MDRFIKFRGKPPSGSRWLYGSYHNQIRKGACEVITEWDTNESFTVMPESVGQWIGVTDQDGNELYEGDIVCIKYFHRNPPSKWPKKSFELVNLVIRYRNGIFEPDDQDQRMSNYDTTFNDWFATCKLVGNIIDTPEYIGTKS